jgi:HEPN domain-containing protein
MRPEAQAWWDQAQADLHAARDILTLEHWFAAAFFAHQSAEAALKALFIVIERHESPRTHNLRAIGERLQAPPEIVEALTRIGPSYTMSRYPEAANAVPARAFSKEMAERLVQQAEQVLGWVSERLKKN